MMQGLEESLHMLEGAEGEKARRAREILTRLLSQEEE